MKREENGPSRVDTMAFMGGVLFCVLVAAIVSLVTCTGHWDGSFPQSEYEIIFEDTGGNPVPDVELRVEDADGNCCFGYPVTDYFGRGDLTSDSQGVLRFHHVNFGAEFGGRIRYLFWAFRLTSSEKPYYVCRFFRAGEEILTVSFDDLNAGDIVARGIRREWDWETCRMVDGEGTDQNRASRGGIALDLGDADTSTVEGQCIRDAWVDILTRRKELKGKAGNMREPLTFPLRRIDAHAFEKTIR